MKAPLRLALMLVLQLLVVITQRQQVLSFQTKVPFLTRGLCHQSGCFRRLPHHDSSHPYNQQQQQRDMPRSHTQELGMLLPGFDFGDAMASAAAVAGMAIAASIVTKEIAAAKATPNTMTDLAFQSNVNNSSFQPKPPKDTPPLTLMSRGVDVQQQQQQLPRVVVDNKIAPPVTAAASSISNSAQQEAVLVVPETIAGIPYVSDSLIDNVQDELVVMEEESERLIVDPLVLDDVESDIITNNVQVELVVMDEEIEDLTVDPLVLDNVESVSILDNPLLYEGGYYEDEEEELFGVYERVEIADDIQDDLVLAPFEAQLDEKGDELSVGTLEVNRPVVVSYLDTLQRTEPPVPYLQSLTSNSVAATELQPVPTYLDRLSDLKVEEPHQQQEFLPVSLDSIAGVPYVSDSLVDAVQDGLVAFEDDERLTVDPLALSRMDDEESSVEIDDRGTTMMTAAQGDTPVDEATQPVFVQQTVEKFPSVLATTADSEQPSSSAAIVDEVQAASTTVANNDKLQSTGIADSVSLQVEGDMFDEQPVELGEEIPRPQLKLSKSFPNQEQPPLPSSPVPFVDPKLDAVRKHLQVKAINMTKALLQKTEQAASAPPASTDFEDATKQLDTEQENPTETTMPVLSLEKEPAQPPILSLDKDVDAKMRSKETKPLLNLEKGVEKTKSSNKKPLLNLSKDDSSTSTKPVLSLEKGITSNNKGSQRGILGVLRKQKVTLAVATLAVVAVKRLVQAIIRRGMF